MTLTISVVSTKGGVGKTTLAANLGGILADLTLRVLLIDGDVQPSLSKYYAIDHRAEHGLHAVITRGGSISADCVSKTTIPGLDIVLSDAPDGYLQNWLKDREDRLVILKRAMRSHSCATTTTLSSSIPKVPSVNYKRQRRWPPI